MNRITERSIAKWQWRNGKRKAPPTFRTLFPNGQRVDQGGHPTKGHGHLSRHGKRSNG